jgi:hypothetical protein
MTPEGMSWETVRLAFPELTRPSAVITRPHQFLLIFKAKCSPKTGTFR